MVVAEFYKENNSFFKIIISGHANSDKYGKDLVCAGITAIVNGSLNAFDKKCGKNVEIIVEENKISIIILESDKLLQEFVDFLKIQLETIQIQYPKNIKIKEVL
ncbi:ribosomal-processing cysteine protease Prp [Spiroplasma apis]|uniref:Ribosomal processing cysteine protease Prp n=1 Tax=Spiroplasma apis B31 TaxID=1276258 RepID=V5RJ29_SPIAP|nr:ribosomal-processing cysteine protease Prp [Spiroplasma apis]AHB36101.1 hypothetical protein SAPIS_v1c02550 [Spiroplasma apis B31]